MENKELEEYLNSLTIFQDTKFETDLETQTWLFIEFMESKLSIDLCDEELQVQQAIKNLVLYYSNLILQDNKKGEY